MNHHTVETYSIGERLHVAIDPVVRNRIPVMLRGPHGIGKSEFVREVAARRGLRLFVINMAMLEGAGEFAGMPVIVDGKTAYAQPKMLPDGPGCMLLIEEMTRAGPHVTAALYEFLSSRQLADYRLPDDCAVVATMNPPGEEYDGHPFDPAMHDRFVHFSVVGSADSWLPWAVGAGVHGAVLDTVRDDPRIFGLASPRSWHNASKLLKTALQSGMDDDEVDCVLRSLLGAEAAFAVRRHLQGHDEGQPPAAADVVAHYGRDPRIPAHVADLLREGRTDAVEKLVVEVEDLLKGKELAGLIAASAFDLDGFERFAADVPGDRGRALLERFAANPHSGAALDVDPGKALVGYPRSALAQQVVAWAAGGKEHRLRALVHRIADHLRRLQDEERLQAVRGTKTFRVNLEQLQNSLGDVGPSLQTVLRRYGLDRPAAEEEGA